MIMSLSKKVFGLLLLLVLGAFVAKAQTISVDYQSVKLSNVISDIQKQSGYSFVYNNSLVNVNAPVTAKASGSIRQVLDAVLSGLPIDYEILDMQITLSPKKKDGRKVAVSGIIKDDTGAPLPGVVIMEKGTSNATVTDNDGKYAISVPSGAMISFSCMGFKEEEHSAPSGGGKIDLQLVSDINYLDEVVVVGYGVQKRANLTGAVSTINFSEGLESRPITSTSSALGGLAPGLAVTQTSGRPGEDAATLRIRGNTTLNTNNPLVLVDGIEYSMDNINPQDIESITVLKDASSTAIYGSRAANGVILITTKGGTAGKIHVSYNNNLTLQMPYLGGLEYVTDYAESMRLVNEGTDNLGIAHVYSDQTIALWENAKLHPDDLNAYGVKNSIAYPNTDWFKEVFHNGFMQRHDLSFSGGTEKVKAYASVGYLDNPGVMSHHGMSSGTTKYDIRTNVEIQFADWLTAGAKLFGERQDYGMMDIASGFQYLKMTIPGMYPGEPDKWGYIATDEENANANNIFKNMAGTAGEEYSYRGSATAFLNARLLKGLTFEVNANHNFNHNHVHSYSASTRIWDYVTDTVQKESSLATAGNKIKTTETYRSNAEALLRYNGVFGKHEVGALAGYSVNHYIQSMASVYKEGKTDWAITELSAYTNLMDSDSSTSDWGLMSGFGRINYAYDNRYLFEANLRYDGSSRFAPESRWGLFPSFSAGWRINEEPWMKGRFPWLDNLKLRASWGVTGNNNSGNYAWQATYTTHNVVSGGQETAGLVVTALGNRELEWETTRTGDIGLDFGFFGNRLTGEIDGYIRNTSGILFRPSIHMTMGNVTAPYENLASVQNKGVELGIKWRDGIGKDFNYSVGLNLAYNLTTVKKYKGTLVQQWVEDEEGKRSYVNNIGDVAQSGFGGYIVEGHILGDQYMRSLYKGTGAGYSGTGDVDINAGPVDGMIRTEADMNWLIAMITAGYKFQGGTAISKNTLYYGDFIYADLDGDGNYGDNDDQHFTGHSYTPKVTAGLNLSMRWKNFDFYALITGAFGFYLNWNTSVYNTTLVNQAQSIMRRIADNHYSAATPNATYPRLTYNKTMNNDLSEFYHYKGDYVKVKSLQIGYTIPKNLTDRIHMEGLRFFVSGENLFTITSYPGQDPEIGTSVGYPLMRSISGGVQVKF